MREHIERADIIEICMNPTYIIDETNINCNNVRFNVLEMTTYSEYFATRSKMISTLIKVLDGFILCVVKPRLTQN